MNVGQVLNTLSGKTTGKGSLDGKNINMADFKKLIEGLFSSKKNQPDTEKNNDILSLLISQLTSMNFAENGVNLNEIKAVDTQKADIASIISKLSLEDIKPFLSENQMISDTITSANGDNAKSLLSAGFNIPKIDDKTITTDNFKEKLTEFISGTLQNNKKQVFDSKKLEDYGNFKKTVLLNRRNDMFSSKDKTPETSVNTTFKNQQKQPVKAESSVSVKDAKEVKQEVNDNIKVKNSSDDIFSSIINKMELKNTSIKEETQLPDIKKESLNEDILKTISYMKDNDVKNLTVKVLPKELGEITIELIYTGDKISAKLTSNTNSTVQLLDQNVSILNSELSKNGVNLQNVSVSLYSGDSSGNERNEGQEYKRREERKQVQEINADEPIEEFGNINIFA